MAALAGWIGAAAQVAAGSAALQMLSAQRHRGAAPASARIALGQDLALDLGCLRDVAGRGEGSSPLAERNGCVLAFDGWISNAAELHRGLLSEGVEVAEATAGEILLAALVRWGTSALPRIQGAWALAFADPSTGQVFLARDHLGKRPLYLHRAARGCFFASEIKGILQGAGGRFAVDAEVAGDFLEQNLLDAQPQTFFAGIQAIPAGHFVSLDCAGPAVRPAEPAPFWTIPASDGFAGSETDRIAAVREAVVEAVGRQLQDADRIGLLVSGGVDSSVVAAVACAVPHAPELVLVSGTVADPRRHDPLLDVLCRHLGRDTHRFSVTPPADRALSDLETVIRFHDEPVRSFAIVAGYRLKQEASRLGVRVLMGGFGSDEIFAGRPLHLVFYVQGLLRSRRWLEAARVAAQIARQRSLRPRFQVAVQKRYFPSLERTRIDVRGPALAAHRRRYDLGLGPGSCQERLLQEITRFSLPALLHYDDRISMAFGLQSRYAFLEPSLVELVAPMPPGCKLQAGFAKWLLRKAMERHLPREICWQKAVRLPRGHSGGSLERELHPQIQALLAGELASVELGLLDRDALRRHYAAFCQQREGAGAISASDVFSWLAIETWARAFESHLKRA
jgi:asparagine synthase (glutamine-hydrolysing)